MHNKAKPSVAPALINKVCTGRLLAISGPTIAPTVPPKAMTGNKRLA